MPLKKQIIVLANSIKHWPGVCIAGREILSDDDGYELGDWIRPISEHGEGELAPGECLLSTGKAPRVLDFVEVPLIRKMNDPLQPENWLIDTSSKWKLLNASYEKPAATLLKEKPTDLWVEPDGRIHRVSAEFLQGKRLKASLRIIHVPNIQARFEWNEWDGRFKQRRRALFSYNGTRYELNITDPEFSERYRSNFPAKGEPACTFTVAPSGGCYLCVSLAPEFNGFHYKVVATIIETQ